MVKRAFVIHGWEGYPEGGWRPWLKNGLESAGFKVLVPAMPDTEHPKIGAWVNHLKNAVGKPDKDCYFVGHSLGCITILRYLESLKKNQLVGGAVLVAGFASSLGTGYDEIGSFIEKPVDWEKIKSHCKKFAAIHSDNDPFVPLYHSELFKEKLGAKLIVIPNMKHFSGDDGVFELPAALEQLLEMQK